MYVVGREECQVSELHSVKKWFRGFLKNTLKLDICKQKMCVPCMEFMLKNFLTTKSDALVAAMVPNSTEFTHALYVCII